MSTDTEVSDISEILGNSHKKIIRKLEDEIFGMNFLKFRGHNIEKVANVKRSYVMKKALPKEELKEGQIWDCTSTIRI